MLYEEDTMRPLLAKVVEFALFASLAVHLPLSVLADDKTPPSSNELVRLQSAYENNLKKLVNDQPKAITNLQCQYISTLSAMEKRAQEDGKLDQVLIILKERDRFNTEKTMEDKNILTGIPEVTKAQRDYLRLLKELPLDKARAVIKLMQQFDKSLATLEQDLTRQGDPTRALEVRSVRDSLNSRPEVSEANSTLAGAEASKHQAPTEQPETPPVKIAMDASQPSNKTENAASSRDKKKDSGKPIIYLKQRFLKLYDALSSGDSQAARALVDPGYLKKEGEGAVDGQLDFILGGAVSLMKEASNTYGKADAMRIRVDEKEGHTATLVPRFWSNGRPYEQPTIYWIQVDGDWYLDIYTDIKKGGKHRDIFIGTWHTKRDR